MLWWVEWFLQLGSDYRSQLWLEFFNGITILEQNEGHIDEMPDR
jgi:hypothetical protein